MAAPETHSASRDEDIASRFEAFLAESEPEEFGDDGTKDAAPGPSEAREEAQPTNDAPDAEQGAAAEEPGAESPEDAPDSPASSEAAEATEAEGVSTLADLAKVFEVEEAELLDAIEITASEGAEPVSLGKVLEAYRSQPDARIEADGARALKAEYEQLRAEHEQKSGESYKQLQALTAAMLDVLEGDHDQAELAKLREEDPSSYLREKERIDRHKGLVDKAIRALQDRESAWGREQDEARARTVREEIAAAQRVRPEWRDSKKAAEDMAQIRSHLIGLGFNDEEITQLADHRAILLAWQASEYQRLTTKQAKTRDRKVLQLPKLNLKRSARREPTRDASGKREAQMKRLRKTGETDDAAVLMEAFLED